jgi:hypothetical protein
MQTKNLATLYDLPTVEWATITERLDEGLNLSPDADSRQSCWLATLNADGSPHLNGIGALWVDGRFWFKTGPSTVKAHNLARDPRCTLTVSTDVFDLSVDGTAEVVTDPTLVSAMTATWAAQGWPAEPDETGEGITAPYSAPSAGPPPWRLYRVDVVRATAILAAAPGGATTWTF